MQIEKKLKAQLSTEYLIIMALVLLIAFVLISFLNFFPNFYISFGYAFNKNFWEKYSEPFAIYNPHYKNSTLRLYFAIESKSPLNLTINAIEINNTKLALFLYNQSNPEGVGSALCSQSSCIYNPCTCTIPLSPYSNISLVTEKYLLNLEDCLQKGINENKIKIIYSGEGFSNYTYSPIFKLAIECINN
jgi:hypothetical protein